MADRDEPFDPFEHPEFKQFAERVRQELIPKLQSSAVSSAIISQGALDHPDVKLAVEFGMSVLMDKPIALLVMPGVKVPDHLVRVADEIIEFNPGPEMAKAIQAFIDKYAPGPKNDD